MGVSKLSVPVVKIVCIIFTVNFFLIGSTLAFSQVVGKPKVTPWEYTVINCSIGDVGPFESFDEAVANGLSFFRNICPTASLSTFFPWPNREDPQRANTCGPTLAYHPSDRDHAFGVENHNIAGYFVELCDGSMSGFGVERDRVVTCEGNVGGNHECKKELFEEKDLTQTCVTNPISINIGNKTETVVDFDSVQGLGVSRVYNSELGSWRFSFEVFLEGGTLGNALITESSGNVIAFSANGDSYIGYADSSSVLRKLVGSDGFPEWELQDSNGDLLTFSSLGKLIKREFRSGVKLTYQYDSVGDLAVIENNRGQKLSLVWRDGRVSEILLPGARKIVYEYDTNRNLEFKKDFENGLETSSITYHYENAGFPNALTGITDENNVRFATWGYDSQGRANSSHHNGGVENKTIDYSFLDDPVDSRVTVTNEFGKETTYHFEIVGGERKKILVEGHQSQNCEAANKSYTYYPSGLLESKTDWQGNVTYFEYNARGLESARTIASNSIAAQTIVTEWHPTFNLPSRIIEANKETVYSYDSEGRKLSESASSSSTFMPGSDNYNAVDGDFDGMADLWEQFFFGGLQNTAIGDFDSDGVSNILEFTFNLNPGDGITDSDGDSLPDAWEFENFDNLEQLDTGDFDGDGVSNYTEFLSGNSASHSDIINRLDLSRTSPELEISNNDSTVHKPTQAGSLSSAIAKGALIPGRKYYWEVSKSEGFFYVGIVNGLVSSIPNNIGYSPESYAWYSHEGKIFHDGFALPGPAGVADDRLMFAYDPDAKKLWIGRNGQWMGDPVNGTGEQYSEIQGLQYPAASISGIASVTFHFQRSDFIYEPPAGFAVTNLHDADSDGLYDVWENQHFGNLDQTGDDDFDVDGVKNTDEFELALDPTDGIADVDTDGLPDFWEVQYFANLNQIASEDFDGDNVNNLDEFTVGENPAFHSQINYLDSSRTVRNLVLTNSNRTLVGGNIANNSRLSFAKGSLAPGKKYYWEVSGSNVGVFLGIAKSSLEVIQGNFPGSTQESFGFYSTNGGLYTDGQLGAIIGSSPGDRLMIAFDPDTGKLWFGRNGIWQGDPSAGTGEHFSNLSGDYFPVVAIQGHAQVTMHFQKNQMLFSPPLGFTYSIVPTLN